MVKLYLRSDEFILSDVEKVLQEQNKDRKLLQNMLLGVFTYSSSLLFQGEQGLNGFLKPSFLE